MTGREKNKDEEYYENLEGLKYKSGSTAKMNIVGKKNLPSHSTDLPHLASQ